MDQKESTCDKKVNLFGLSKGDLDVARRRTDVGEGSLRVSYRGTYFHVAGQPSPTAAGGYFTKSWSGESDTAALKAPGGLKTQSGLDEVLFMGRRLAPGSESEEIRKVPVKLRRC